MVKFLQIITILSCIVGSVAGIGLLHVQAGRDSGENSSGTLTATKPCMDASGEPTC